MGWHEEPCEEPTEVVELYSEFITDTPSVAGLWFVSWWMDETGQKYKRLRDTKRKDATVAWRKWHDRNPNAGTD